MKTRINLLEGNILPALSALALPIMATSLIQMAYNPVSYTHLDVYKRQVSQGSGFL